MIPNDDTLMAFVQWCRMNGWQITSDPEIVRRVFHAYTGLDLRTDDKDAAVAAARKQIEDERYPSVTDTP